MSISPTSQTTGDPFEHLPHYSALMEYDISNWVCFGTLTHKYPASPAVQIARFKTLMDTIGSLNHSFGRRLHWVVRVEGKNEGDAANLQDEEKRAHLHFLLARHKVVDGHKHQLTPAGTCHFMEKVWEYGRAEVEPYDPAKDGLGYILKCPSGPKSKEWEDTVEMSPSLLTYLTKKKLMEPYADRDPFAVGILLELRKRGTQACFGDEIPRWRAA
jgi:hypothetical protein